jgi:hypothetical protein
VDGTGLPEEAVAVPGSAEPPAARKAFAALTALVTEAQPMTVVLEAVAYLTHHVVPGAAGVSILRPAGDGVTGLVRTAEVAGALDAAQTPGGGPGVHAARTGEVVLVPDARTEDRWPRYAREAVGSGVLSCLAVPIPAVGGAAALTVYGEPAGAFDCAACALVTRFAGSASAALGYLIAQQEIATGLARSGLLDPRCLDQGTSDPAGGAGAVVPLRARTSRTRGCGRPSHRW